MTRWKVGFVNALEKLIKIGSAVDGIESISDSFPTLLPLAVIKIGRSLLFTSIQLVSILQQPKMAKVELSESLKYNVSKPEVVQWAGAVWRYNGDVPDNPGYDYLARTAENFRLLESYFPGYKNIIPDNDWIVGSDRDEMLDKFLNYEIGDIHSPGELRAYDAAGRIVGTVNSDVRNEVPYSDYFGEAFLILAPSDAYLYEIAGTDIGLYDLTLNKIINGQMHSFEALNIPIQGTSVHQFTVDWDALSRGEDGVTLTIDADGDGLGCELHLGYDGAGIGGLGNI